MKTPVTRKIVKIDEEKCDGCGLCVPDCAEGAIQIVNGKARLVADNLCDGLGNCLGSCPQGAITIEERPADEYDEEAVKIHLQAPSEADSPLPVMTASPVEPPCGCPGAAMRVFRSNASRDASSLSRETKTSSASRLDHWPVQLSLLPVTGPLWHDADVLFAADCVPFAMPDFHERLLEGKTLAVACPKLDDPQPYVAKLATIFAHHAIKSLTVARMEVPCCGGLEHIVRAAMAKAQATFPLDVVIVSTRGTVKSVNGAVHRGS